MSTLMIRRMPDGGRALDHIVAHVVAFANAVRHVEVGRAAAEFNRSLQNDDGHGAVDVVVAVDQNGLFAFDGGVDAVDGGAQAESSDREREDERATAKRNALADSASVMPRRTSSGARMCAALATPRRAGSARSPQSSIDATIVLIGWLLNPPHRRAAVILSAFSARRISALRRIARTCFAQDDKH